MKPEVFLKAFALHQSEDGFRELVVSTMDEVYSVASRLVQSPPHLVEETVLRVYWELAHEAPRMSDEVVLSVWLREHTCKAAAKVLHEDDRAIDRLALEEEKKAVCPGKIEAAPPGLAIRISQGILLNRACNKSSWASVPRITLPAWVRPVHIGAAAACILAVFLVWKNPFHKRNPIVMSSQTRMTPAAFGQLATADPEEVFVPAVENHSRELDSNLTSK